MRVSGGPRPPRTQTPALTHHSPCGSGATAGIIRADNMSSLPRLKLGDAEPTARLLDSATASYSTWGGDVVGCVMEQEFYSGFAQRARDLAEKADPFTRRRLLELA